MNVAQNAMVMWKEVGRFFRPLYPAIKGYSSALYPLTRQQRKELLQLLERLGETSQVDELSVEFVISFAVPKERQFHDPDLLTDVGSTARATVKVTRDLTGQHAFVFVNANWLRCLEPMVRFATALAPVLPFDSLEDYAEGFDRGLREVKLHRDDALSAPLQGPLTGTEIFTRFFERSRRLSYEWTLSQWTTPVVNSSTAKGRSDYESRIMSDPFRQVGYQGQFFIGDARLTYSIVAGDAVKWDWAGAVIGATAPEHYFNARAMELPFDGEMSVEGMRFYGVAGTLATNEGKPDVTLEPVTKITPTRSNIPLGVLLSAAGILVVAGWCAAGATIVRRIIQ